MLLNDNNNLIKKVTFFYDSKNTNMAGPPSSQSELSYEHTYIQIDNKLDWNKHISTVAARGQSKLAFLNRNLKGCPKKLRDTVTQLIFHSLGLH